MSTSQIEYHAIEEESRAVRRRNRVLFFFSSLSLQRKSMLCALCESVCVDCAHNYLSRRPAARRDPFVRSMTPLPTYSKLTKLTSYAITTAMLYTVRLPPSPSCEGCSRAPCCFSFPPPTLNSGYLTKYRYVYIPAVDISWASILQ